ncbi:uncharacterized protein LOC128873406 isoform X1 [Hylaeus volcanicus]|uniref:uncharacterized protein LOC128873406 isoform X1 n=1 Tax=Hylaeus volcanicus TaxID=313075 RepID=UPI0023B8499E|nr:uncharacterized protein LOC128873406 isoform X1 [Hylaeus volcanicus]
MQVRFSGEIIVLEGRGRKRIRRSGPSSTTRSIPIRFFISTVLIEWPENDLLASCARSMLDCKVSVGQYRIRRLWRLARVRDRSMFLGIKLFSQYVIGSLCNRVSGGGSSYGGGHGVELGHLSGGIHDSLSNYGSYGYGGGGIDHGLHGGHVQHHYAAAVPVSEHVEITKPVPIPVIKNIGVPVAQPVAIPVPHPVAVGVPQPYPVHVPVAKPVLIPVVKTIAVPVEKKVPFPVEKVIPVPVEKPVPITVEKHIPVPVEKPYPIHIPVYKHVFHRVKSHGHGWH